MINMPFPRLQPYVFNADQTYVVQNQDVGRIDKISQNIYDYIQTYKPLLKLNKLSLGIGMRVGIRPTREAIATELAIKNKSTTVTEEQINEVFLSIEPNSYEWTSYGDISNGYVSDVNNGDVLLVPSFESAERWLRTYQFINQEDGTTYTS
jgi:hypothetical protein